MKMMQGFAGSCMSNSGESWLFPDCSRIRPTVHCVIQNLRAAHKALVFGQRSQASKPSLGTKTHSFREREQKLQVRERWGVGVGLGVFFLNRFKVSIGTRKF